MYISFSESRVSTYPVRYQPTSHLPTPCIINPRGLPCTCGYRSRIYLPRALSTHMVSHSAYYPENQRFQALCSLQVAAPCGYRSPVYLPRALSTHIFVRVVYTAKCVAISIKITSFTALIPCFCTFSVAFSIVTPPFSDATRKTHVDGARGCTYSYYRTQVAYA